MRWLVVGVVMAAVVAVAVGCGAAAPPPASVVVPSSGPCAGIPITPRDQPPESLPLTVDLTLEAKFPAQIDGNPVTDVASGAWIETLCMIGGESTVRAAGANLPNGLDVTDMRVATGQATVDGQGVTITAFRLPGRSGAELIPALGIMSVAMGGDPSRFSSLAESTVAGKPVSTWTDPTDGSTSYIYSTGDTLFLVQGATASQADKVFAALP